MVATSAQFQTPAPENQPFTLSVKDAARHFGFSAGQLYNMISGGLLARGTHYYKVGRRVMIIREAFIDWMREQDGARG